MVYFGNKEFVVGDYVQCFQGGVGGGSGEGDVSDFGEGIDEFVFQISQDEFFDFLFEDLELFNLVKCQLQGVEIFKYVCVGIINDGNFVKINVVCFMCQVISRCIVLGVFSCRRLCEFEVEFVVFQE